MNEAIISRLSIGILTSTTIAVLAAATWVIATRPGGQPAPVFGYFPTAASAKTLRVPFVQQSTGIDCLPACAAMLLQFNGMSIPADQLNRLDELNCVSGTHLSDLALLLKSWGVSATIWYPGSTEDLQCMLEQGVPILVSQELASSAGRSVHAVVVIGEDPTSGAFVVHDPYYGASLSVASDTLDVRWLKAGGYTRVAMSLGSASSISRAGINLITEDANPEFLGALRLIECGEMEGAVAALETVITRLPNFVPAYLVLGSCLSRLERLEKSESVLAAACALDGGYYWGIGWLKLGAVQVAQGNREAGRMHVERFLECQPLELPELVADARRLLRAIATSGPSPEP